MRLEGKSLLPRLARPLAGWPLMATHSISSLRQFLRDVFFEDFLHRQQDDYLVLLAEEGVYLRQRVGGIIEGDEASLEAMTL